jgi:hypothetical protein
MSPKMTDEEILFDRQGKYRPPKIVIWGKIGEETHKWCE